MRQKAALEYLMKVLAKMRLQTVLYAPGNETGNVPDMGLRRFLGVKENYHRHEFDLKEQTVYKITDEFLCRYVALRFGAEMEDDALLIGPYMSFAPTAEQVMEQAERLGLSAAQMPQLKRYYDTVPVVTDESDLMILINAFAETLWGGGNAYRIEELNREGTVPAAPGDVRGEKDDILMQMQVMERRYAYENEMMEMVAKGLTHRAKTMISRIPVNMFEQRMADPVRNAKNYLIICNTLLRKAAQQGGVHPLYLDRISSDFAARIELIRHTEEGRELMGEMILGYCRLVRKHTLHRYSAPVQKAVTYIEAEPARDLHLQHLARTLNLSAGYLSSLFHSETGRTVTEYVTHVRMETAANLLRSTQLQIQTVAQHCGITDVNYFSKVFKKHFGMTPRQYRQEQKEDNKTRKKT